MILKVSIFHRGLIYEGLLSIGGLICREVFLGCSYTSRDVFKSFWNFRFFIGAYLLRGLLSIGGLICWGGVFMGFLYFEVCFSDFESFDFS